MKSPDEMIGLRRIVIERFHPLQRVPTTTINMDVFIEPALALRERLAADPRSKRNKATFNHIILKATALALRGHMLFNHDHDGKGRIYENRTIDIRSPVDFGDFPMHIVVPETDRKDLFEIAASFAERHAEARARVEPLMRKYLSFRKNMRAFSAGADALFAFLRHARPLLPAWERNWFRVQHRIYGTFMVTNMGALGVVDCHGQLVKPSIGALLVMAVKDVVEIKDGVPVVRKYLPLALEYDGRVATAEQAGALLAEIKRNLEEPDRIAPG
jgi:pyruvate/2-oxoglutarate dehydrogenase complex dihydrolipoamide acyltransferase (E2) component